MAKKHNPNLKYKQFRDWNKKSVEWDLGIIPCDTLPALESWLTAKFEISKEDAVYADKLRRMLADQIFRWNERELTTHFIGPLLVMVDFRGHGFQSFMEAEWEAQVDGWILGGKTDWVCATGSDKPIAPYFFIQEYKRQKGYSNDPQGQLLAAMAAAAALNGSQEPLFGCYVIGVYWRFVVLDGKQYAESQGYDATDPGELQIIWSMLQEAKRMVAIRAGEPGAV